MFSRRLPGDQHGSRLDFQKLRTVGEILIALIGHQHYIFESYAANTEIIESGFYRYHMPALERGIDRRNSRRLVNIQTKSMTCAMKESLHATFDLSGRKTFPGKKIEYLLMDFFAIDAIANQVKADLLSGLHSRVDLLEFVRCSSTHHRSAEISEITGFLRAGEDIEDNRGVRFDWAGSLVMRVDALITGRDDRVAGQPSLRHDRGVHRGFQHFGCELRAVQMELAVVSGFGLFEHPNPGIEAQFRHVQRLGYVPHFLITFDFTLREKWIRRDLEIEAFISQLIRQKR